MTTPEPTVDRIPIGRSINYAVRGVPEIGDEYNAERTIDPTEITLIYRATPDSHLGRTSVYVKGWWMQDGKRVPMDKPVGRWLYGNADSWPAWLAEEARLHDPDNQPAAGQTTGEVLRIVSDWCIEANECGGVDAGDLAFRLTRAGYELPDDDATA